MYKMTAKDEDLEKLKIERRDSLIVDDEDSVDYTATVLSPE
jgi:hypothetical protein